MATPARLFVTLGDIVRNWVNNSPDDPALITPEGTWTIRAFADMIDAQTRTITRSTRPGARIGVNATNTAEFVALLYSVPSVGRTLVPLNTRLTASERIDQLGRARVALLVGDEIPGSPVPRRDLASFSTDDHSGETTSRDVVDASTASGTPDDIAWIIFTSGSTGRPKGVLVTHASLAAAVATTAAARPLADDEVYLFPFPLFHVAAYNVLHAHARRRPVVLPRSFDAHAVIRMSRRHRVTAMSLTATMLRMLLDSLHGADPRALPDLRTIAYGAAPMPITLLREASERLGCAFAQGYGSTELSGNAVFLGPEDHRRGLAGATNLLRAAGRSGPGVELRIVDDAGAEVPDGLPGEVCIAADQVCVGYLDDPAASAATIREGWLHTGDIGVLENGLLSIVDRAKDMVVTGGENVSSREVEDALRSHPEVGDVAVIGIEDPYWGEAVAAVIVPRGGTGSPTLEAADDAFATDLITHVTRRLAGYKKPRAIYCIDALPTNANGKVDKPAIRRLVADPTRR